MGYNESSAVGSEGSVTMHRSALVVDDEAGFRELVMSLLDRVSVQTSEAENGQEALKAARINPPILVVLDVRLPDLSGFEVCRELREEFGDDLPIVFVSGEKMDDIDRSAGLLVGADDYLVKPIDPTEFLARVRRMISRGRERAPDENGAVSNGHRVTPREQQVLALLAEGKDRATIARILVISPRTVGSHIQRLLAKLGVHSQAQAVALAYREGLFAPANGGGSATDERRGRVSSAI
jgi:DNA-binding NarL/FixJ family response regulator